MRAALTIAACDFVDDLPEGVNTIIGEEGLSLSGGQRQRLSFGACPGGSPERAAA